MAISAVRWAVCKYICAQVIVLLWRQNNIVALVVPLRPVSFWVRAVTSIIVRIVPVCRSTISTNARANSTSITVLAVAINTIVDSVIVPINTTVNDIGAETGIGIQELTLNACALHLGFNQGKRSRACQTISCNEIAVLAVGIARTTQIVSIVVVTQATVSFRLAR